MPGWERRTYKLDANHKWKARPGCQIFVADWGAVRFDVPRGWVPVPVEGNAHLQQKLRPSQPAST